MNVPSVLGADPCIAMVIILAVLGPGWHLRLTDRGGGLPHCWGPTCSPCCQGEARALCLGSPLLSALQLSLQGPQTTFCNPAKGDMGV